MIYIAFLFFTFLILAFAFYQWQYFMVFSPTFHREGEFCDECTLLSMRTDDGLELEGAMFEPKDALSTLLVFVGRSHDAVGIINKLAFTYPHSRVISFNYRSYGKSQGRISEKNLQNDALKIAKLIEKNYGEFSILGYSLGSSLGAYVASKRQIKRLFLVGAFDSIASLAKSKFVDRGFIPYINLAQLFRYKFRTSDYVSKVDAETFLFVSRHDETTYIQNARELKSSVKNLQFYMELDELNHKEILWDERVTKKINEFLNV